MFYFSLLYFEDFGYGFLEFCVDGLVGSAVVKTRFRRLFSLQTCNVRSARRGLLTLLQKWMVSKLVCYVPFGCNLRCFLSRVIFLWISLLHMFGKLLIDFEGLLEKNCFLKINNWFLRGNFRRMNRSIWFPTGSQRRERESEGNAYIIHKRWSLLVSP